MSLTGISANRLELLQIAEAVAREKSIDKEVVIEAIEEAIQKGARARYGAEHDIRVRIDPKTGELAGMYGGMIASAVSFVFGLAVTAVIYRDEKTENLAVSTEEDGKVVEREILDSPLTGTMVALEDVPDEAFSSGVMGKGVAINPTEGRVVAPADCTIATMFPTGHAMGLITEKGAELLIHVGMDTVKLEGKYFTVKVKQGEHVKKGQVLVEFDIEKIKAAGYSVITPVIVTNHAQYMDIVTTNETKIKEDESLITVIA